MFEDENFIESSVAKLNALRKSGQFCDVRLQVFKTLIGNLQSCSVITKNPEFLGLFVFLFIGGI